MKIKGKYKEKIEKLKQEKENCEKKISNFKELYTSVKLHRLYKVKNELEAEKNKTYEKNYELIIQEKTNEINEKIEIVKEKLK